jgi:hypothetical protein
LKFYLIRYRSDYVWNDDSKIVADSIKQAVDFAKDQLKFMRDYYLLRPNYDSLNYKDKYKYVHKRFRTSKMYADLSDGKSKIVGKTISITGRPKNIDDDETLITAWIEHIPTNEVKYYAGFKEIEQ